MQQTSNIYFVKQTDAEKKSRLNIAKNTRLVFTLWEKGSKYREIYEIKDFIPGKLEIILSPHSKSTLNEKNVLYNFEINGVTYFGSSQIRYVSNGQYSIDCRNELYKGERRKNFRLMTYPQYKFYVIFDTKDRYEGSNVVNIVSGFSQTALFKNFLKMLGEKSEMNIDPEGQISFRMQDLSVTGLSFNVSELERKYFPKGMILPAFKIFFNGEEIQIPEGKVIYQVDYFVKEKNTRTFKVGIEFQKMDTNMDHILGGKINALLRDTEDNTNFEDFIK